MWCDVTECPVFERRLALMGQGRPSPKSHDATFPLLSFLLPFLPPFFLFSILPIPFPSLPFLPLTLEVGPLKSSYGSGGLGSAVSSPNGVWVGAQPKSNLMHFSLKIWDLLYGDNNFNYFFDNQLTEFELCPPNFFIFVPRGFLWRSFRHRECFCYCGLPYCGPLAAAPRFSSKYSGGQYYFWWTNKPQNAASPSRG